MEKLNAQDAGFLKIESPHCPFHAGGLMLFKRPEDAPGNYMRRIARICERLNELWPICNKQLKDPEDLSHPVWVPAEDYRPKYHVFHYALPQPGRMDDLLELVTRAHERMLDRSRPLWEMHVIEGVPGNRFALFVKLHHALMDGYAAIRMIHMLMNPSPTGTVDFNKPYSAAQRHSAHHSLLEQLGDLAGDLVKQYKALPELSQMLVHMGADALKGKKDVMRLPYTAPRTLFNTDLDSRRRIILCDLPLNAVRKLAHQYGGTINDVLLAVCGGALRRYLIAQDALPEDSLVVGVPISLKSQGDQVGNSVSYMAAPFFTDEKNDLRRLKRVIKVTRDAKAELSKISATAAEDYYALIMAPATLLTVTGNAGRARPAVNAIFSNVPGSREKLYMEGAELESIYPLSIITDGMGINFTVISHANKLCFAIASCPTHQPGTERLGKLMKASYREMQAAARA
jgi:diacylglycerol O-acyltransferase